MKRLLPWTLWLWMSVCIVAAFEYAPLAKGFLGESSRILFFHVPMAWVSFVAFGAAGFWSVRYIAFGRRPEHDLAAASAVELGLVFAALATVTGSIWARIMWGAWWNWDPREISITMVLLFYAAYLALRGAVEDAQARARLSGSYAIVGLVVAPFLYFVLPRITYSLHPEPVVNAQAKIDMESRMLQVLFASLAGYTALFFWLHSLRRRLARIEVKAESESAA